MNNEISVINSMAAAQGMSPKEYELTVRDTCGCKGATLEQFHAFLLVAREYGLNPLVKEIYAFPSKTGGITPIVSIDGWLRMANDHDQFDGLTFEDRFDAGGNLIGITAQLHRKDRGHPSEVTEYMVECRRNTDPWKQWPARMLRHKAAIQAIRYGLGFSGIADPDEGERMLPAREPLTNSVKAVAPGITVAHVERIEPQATAVTAATAADMERSRLAVNKAAKVGDLERMQTVTEQRLKTGFYTPAQADELLNLINGKLDILTSEPEDRGQEFPHEAAEHEVTA